MKPAEFLSERVLFGILIILGFIVILHEMIYEQAALRPEIVSIVAGGIGALATAVGIIVQAIWKTDKADKQNADTASVLAAKAPDLSGQPAPIPQSQPEPQK
jgi:hypothetical protein